MSEVDFIVVTRDQLHYTKGCVESILKYAGRSFHLIVVDNASAKETRDYLEDLKTRGEGKKRITIIFNSENEGYALGLNGGLKHSDAPYVVFCNNDIELYPGAIDEMVRIAEQNEQFGLVNPNSNEFGLTSYDPAQVESLKGKWMERCHTSGFCVLVKRKVIQAIHGIDPLFNPAYFEDMDFAERAKHAGFLCVVARGAYIHHFGTRTFLPKEKQALWDKHKERFVARWGGTKWYACFVSDALIRDKKKREHIVDDLMSLARREIAIIHLFLPLGTRHHFENLHESFRIVETPGWIRTMAFLWKSWRSATNKPITRIYVTEESTKSYWQGLKPLHRAEVLTFEKDLVASS